jgi:hypothetical protein
VDLEHLPGEYAVSHAEFYTASGQEIRHDIRADKPIPSRIRVKNHTFGIVPEPNSIDRATLEFVDARQRKKLLRKARLRRSINTGAVDAGST